MALRIRVPYWASGGSASSMASLSMVSPVWGVTLLDRVWRNGDRVDIRLPMSLLRGADAG